MIYKIESKFVTEMSIDMYIVLLSADGLFALIKSDSQPTFIFIEEMDE